MTYCWSKPEHPEKNPHRQLRILRVLKHSVTTIFKKIELYDMSWLMQIFSLFYCQTHIFVMSNVAVGVANQCKTECMKLSLSKTGMPVVIGKKNHAPSCSFSSHLHDRLWTLDSNLDVCSLGSPAKQEMITSNRLLTHFSCFLRNSMKAKRAETHLHILTVVK